jgi:hypothetical protein
MFPRDGDFLTAPPIKRQHYYTDVPKLGNVAVTRHAQAQMDKEGISPFDFERALLQPIRADRPDGQDVLWRERDGLRIVILMNPTPFAGARLVKTVYRIQPQAKAVR